MSPDNGRFIGIGVALVDHIFNKTEHISPFTSEETLSFIETHKPNLVRPGAPMPNTFTAISQLSVHRRLRLFHCVGSDNRGDFFRKETDPKIGLAQVHPTEPTGVWVGFYNEKGGLRFSMASYGAALQVRVSPTDLDEEPNGVFITDISSCENEAIHNQTDTILKRLDHDGGVFALSLGGPRTPFLNHLKMESIINSFRYKPHIVFSNADEFRYYTRTEDIESSLFDYFPNARLVVITLDQQGSIMRFEDRLIRIPAVLVTNPIDELGAGDTYMGTMLGQLFNQPYDSWNFNLVEDAAHVATFAASRVVQSTQSRLTTEMAQLTQEYARNLNLQ